MLMAYASVAAFFLVAIGFVLGSMIAGRFIRPNNMYAEKLETYECGEAPVGPAWFNFNPRFYIIALIYIVINASLSKFARTLEARQGVRHTGRRNLRTLVRGRASR